MCLTGCPFLGTRLKPQERDRDAKDFRLIMYNYLEVQPGEYVYDTYPDIAGDGDYELISARTLGRDMGKTAMPELPSALRAIFDRECDTHGKLLFVTHMQQRYNEVTTAKRDIEMLKAVRQGVTDSISLPGMYPVRKQGPM